MALVAAPAIASQNAQYVISASTMYFTSFTLRQGRIAHTVQTNAVEFPGACLPQAGPTLRAFVSCEWWGF